MADQHKIHKCAGKGGLLRRLARDKSGNTLALMAAAIFPLMGMVGGGIDMGRAYLASARLQQACDAGVLAARKQLGTEAAVNGNIPGSVAVIGDRFFNVNFSRGTYGTKKREFQMTLEGNYAISGNAAVEVPTSIMRVFGYTDIPISVTCEAELSISNLDIMMVLDVTGSMRHTNPGDSLSRIDSLKQVIRNFHNQLEAAKNAGGRVRYGFVPYSSNVNVGHLLADEWVVDNWEYQSRERDITTPSSATTSYYENLSGLISGSSTAAYEISREPATLSASGDSFYCAGTKPSNTYIKTESSRGPAVTEINPGPPEVEQTREPIEFVENGSTWYWALEGNECSLRQKDWINRVEHADKIVRPQFNYIYRPIARDLTNWRTETDGCIEERSTYEINDYNNVDLTRALDLDIDLVPTPGDPDTQWRPHHADNIYVRSFTSNNSGSFTVDPVTTASNYIDTSYWWFSYCPAPAQKLQEMTTEQVDTYLATLEPFGATYHDIGMLWGARLLSPSGLFTAENQDMPDKPSSRHMIFLTDGQTEAYDIAYAAYGVEGLDRRRWTPESTLTLAETVDARFGVACEEAKKRNIVVWVITFGTFANDTMIQCAGNGRYFEASSAEALNSAFASIARSIGDLRITK